MADHAFPRTEATHAAAPFEGEGKRRVLSVYLVARTLIERHVKVRGEANPYQPEAVEYFEKRRWFAWPQHLNF